MARFLYKETPLEVLKPQNGYLGSRLLRACFEAGVLDIALRLLEKCVDIIFAAEHIKWTPVASIVIMPAAVPRASQLGFWKRWIYHSIPIPSTRIITDNVCLDIQQEGDNKSIQGHGLPHRFISNVHTLLGVKKIYDLKLKHALASQILKLLCRRVTLLDEPQHRIAINHSLYLTAKGGLADFLCEASKTNPELMQFGSRLGNWNTFFFAIRHRQAEVFNLIHEYHFKNLITSVVDTSKNCMLHVAAKLVPSNRQLHCGAAPQMQSEMQWFKEVERVVPPGLRLSQNSSGQQPEDIFKETHKDLRDAGEKWMNDTASSYSVVGALIVTIMFAAAFTVPGGNDQNTSYPVFLKDKLFILFMISDALSLFFSTTSALIFLGIFTSRYAEIDFLISLPKKLIIGLSTLFLSILTMMAAFCSSIILIFQRTYSWSYIPVIIVASFPITLFVLLQFPLLLDVIYSTYGPGIFKRNVK